MSKRHNPLSFDEKQKIIEAAEQNSNKSDLARQLSHQFDSIPRTTIIGVLKEKEKIQDALVSGSDAKRAKLKTAKHEDLDKAVLTWHKTVMSHPDVTVSAELLMEKAKEFADHLGIDDFKASDGWLEKFKRRNSITFGKRHGEAADVDLVALGTWQANVLQTKLAEYSADNIYNADETGLFWRAFPDKTHKIKGERCAGGKKAKDRISVLVGASMAGDKMPLLVIGKSAKPRCFKQKEVPLDYQANTRAWMIGAVFEQFLKKWRIAKFC